MYGVNEAARFYFDKQPSNLNLSESLYLASIIPRPKRFQASFNQYGEMRSAARYFHRLIADLMERKGMISEGDRESVTYNLSFPGRAHGSIFRAVRPDTTRVTFAADSSQFEPLNLIDLLGGESPPDAGVNTNAGPPPPPTTPAPKQ